MSQILERNKSREAEMRDAALVILDRFGSDNMVSFQKGIRWAYNHPIISKETIMSLIEGIKSGEHKTLSQYANDKEREKIFNDGQLSILSLLFEYIVFSDPDYEKDEKLDEYISR